MKNSLTTENSSLPLSYEETNVLARTNQTIPSNTTLPIQNSPFHKTSYKDSLTKSTKNDTSYITTHTTTLYESFLTNETTPTHAGASFIPISIENKKRMYEK